MLFVHVGSSLVEMKKKMPGLFFLFELPDSRWDCILQGGQVCQGKNLYSQNTLGNSLGSCPVGSTCYLSINPAQPVSPPVLGQITISPVRLQKK